MIFRIALDRAQKVEIWSMSPAFDSCASKYGLVLESECLQRRVEKVVEFLLMTAPTLAKRSILNAIATGVVR